MAKRLAVAHAVIIADGFGRYTTLLVNSAMRCLKKFLTRINENDTIVFEIGRHVFVGYDGAMAWAGSLGFETEGGHAVFAGLGRRAGKGHFINFGKKTSRRIRLLLSALSARGRNPWSGFVASKPIFGNIDAAGTGPWIEFAALGVRDHHQAVIGLKAI